MSTRLPLSRSKDSRPGVNERGWDNRLPNPHLLPPCHPPPPNLLVPKSKYQLLPIWFWVLSLLTHHILKCCPQTKLLNWSPLPSFPLMQCGNGWVILFGMRSSDWPVTCQPPGGSSSSPYRNTLGSYSSTIILQVPIAHLLCQTDRRIVGCIL